ncbi:hypothetical protein ACQKCH_12060 [Nubsella zeaxanthinifaciens]|uniref:hypothetical protein n=1 Tax=Nubsella zeaxanthinifaciens TaxID=392412 RepID=UPI003CFCB769
MIQQVINNGKFILRTAVPEDAAPMAEVQHICYPTLSKEEILTEEHFANHIKLFPEGQIVITDNGRVIASTSTFRSHFPDHDHTFMEATDNLWLTKSHQLDGDWLYGIDMGVLPDYRGLRLSTAMYDARQEVAEKLGMKGQITVGMTIGYGRYKDEMSIQEYCEKLKNNELTDPTVTPQRKAGFQWIKPIYEYLEDPTAGNCSVLMAWPLKGIDIAELVKKYH